MTEHFVPVVVFVSVEHDHASVASSIAEGVVRHAVAAQAVVVKGPYGFAHKLTEERGGETFEVRVDRLMTLSHAMKKGYLGLVAKPPVMRGIGYERFEG